MIVREIKTNPESVLQSFDWFNDSKDTIDWARRNCPQSTVDALVEGERNYWKERNKRFTS